ncbi:MAG: DUF456 domain-containing protein [Balneolaceae bacterium]
MEIIWITLGIVLIISGFIGSFLPIIPGPPLSFVGLLMLQLTPNTPFSLQFLIFWAVVVVVLMILDNVIPAYGTKKFGGSAWGIWGCMLGMAAGIFFPPLGLVVGPLLGALIGELLAGKNSDQAILSAVGSFAGFLVSTLLKVIATAVMGYYFIINI